MLDWLALGALTAGIAIFLRVVVLTRIRALRRLSWKSAAVAGLLIASAILFSLSRSRSFQFFGHLVTAPVPTAARVVALTFDDGPTGKFTPEILDLLQREQVKATFFVIGDDVRRAPDAARAIAAAGHELGNHSRTHKRMIFRSQRWIREEIEQTDASIRSVGYRGTIHFRSPYAKRLASLPCYLAKHDRLNILFDVEPESDPAIDASAEAIADHVLKNTRPGSIILLHPMYASRTNTRIALPWIIAGLKSRGYRFVTVSELLKMRRGRGGSSPLRVALRAAPESGQSSFVMTIAVSPSG